MQRYVFAFFLLPTLHQPHRRARALHYSLLRRGEKAPHTALSRMAGKGGDMRARALLARLPAQQ